MRLIGMMLVRNSASELQSTLDAMSTYCDAVVVVDDRSDDDTLDIARAHHVVRDVVSMPAPSGPNVDWMIPEATLLDTLYRLADNANPDWLIRLDDDEYLEGAESLRGVLAEQPAEVSAVRFPRVSTWNDSDYPQMVPLMSSASSMNAVVLRHYPGLVAAQPMHNLLPRITEERGRITTDERVRFVHTGWNTLHRRIERARTYTRLDPTCQWNHGTAYDRGLLFGYSFDELDDLKSEYARRSAADEVRV